MQGRLKQKRECGGEGGGGEGRGEARGGLWSDMRGRGEPSCLGDSAHLIQLPGREGERSRGNLEEGAGNLKADTNVFSPTHTHIHTPAFPQAPQHGRWPLPRSVACGRGHLIWLTEVWSWGLGSSLTAGAWAEFGAWASLSSPSAERRHARHEAPYSSPLPPLLPLCLFFLGFCPENDWLQWTLEEEHSLRTQYRSCLPSCLLGQTNALRFHKSTPPYLCGNSIFCFLSSLQKDWI